MPLLHQIFVFLHVVSAAAWFGMGLRLATQARTVLSLERDAALALADDVARTVRFMGIFIVLTLVFAFGVLGLGGGYPGQFQYHTASLLIVILIVVQWALVQPAWKKLRAAVEAGSDAERLFLIQMLPDILAQVVNTVDNLKIDKLTVVDSGQGTGVPSVFNQIAGSTPALLESLKASTGIDIAGMLSRAAATPSAETTVEDKPTGDGSL